MHKYIELKDVCYKYKRSTFELKNISVSFFEGEFTAIVGRNGSGKTTLGKVMAGVLHPDKGEMLICGQDSRDFKLHEFGKKIGYAFQNPDRQLFTNSCFEEVTFPLRLSGMDKEQINLKAEGLLHRFDLIHRKDFLPIRLSRGEKQRLALASILALEPKFLILDEPTTGLDRDRRDMLYKLLNDFKLQGIGMAVITHDLTFVKKCADRIITMSGGEVIGDKKQA